jgi:hypothetical protein
VVHQSERNWIEVVDLQLELLFVLLNAVTLFPSIGGFFNEDSSRYIAIMQFNITVTLHVLHPRLLYTFNAALFPPSSTIATRHCNTAVDKVSQHCTTAAVWIVLSGACFPLSTIAVSLALLPVAEPIPVSECGKGPPLQHAESSHCEYVTTDAVLV